MKYIIIFIIIINIINLRANDKNFDKRAYFKYGTNIYTDAIVIPDEKVDSSDVTILFKILYDALSFTQVNPLENPGSYRAIAETEVILQDNQNIIKGRLNWIDTLFVDTFADTKSKNLYLEGQVTKRLATGKYTATIELITKIKQDNNNKTFDINIPSNKNNIISQPIFGTLLSKAKSSYFKPFIWDNKINFAAKQVDVLGCAILPSNSDLYYTLKRVSSKELNYKDDSINITSQITINPNINLKYNKIMESWELIPNTSNKSKISIITFQLPIEKLTPGNYQLTIKDNNSELKYETNFDIEWIDMPYSLRDFEYSYKILYYLTTDEQYKELTSGSDKEILKKMSDFWKSKDPTVGTPFNEALEQYYKRVDYAFFNFKTINENDGAKTARGKIYILYGQPTEISEHFVNGNAQEVWYYKKLNKKFIFEIRNAGIFELISIEG